VEYELPEIIENVNVEAKPRAEVPRAEPTKSKMIFDDGASIFEQDAEGRQPTTIIKPSEIKPVTPLDLLKPLTDRYHEPVKILMENPDISAPQERSVVAPVDGKVVNVLPKEREPEVKEILPGGIRVFTDEKRVIRG